MQFLADMTGLSVTVPRAPEPAALGAAMVGMLGMRMCASFDELAKLPRDIEGYRPDMPSERVITLYAGWRDAVSRVRRES
jgi:glycerol kinase